MVDKRAVYWRVAQSFMNSAVVFAVLGVLLVVVLGIVSATGGARLAFATLSTVSVTAAAMWLFSELVVKLLMKGTLAEPERDGRLIRIMTELCQRHGFAMPRLYVFDLERPNAAAFGPGLPGLSAVGVTNSLMFLLDDAELEGVLAHEVGHIRCRDIGVATLIAIGTDGIAQVSGSLKRGAFRGAYPAYFVAFVSFLLNRFLLPVFRAALMQEREYAADALSALYCGTPFPLISALEKLSASRPPTSEVTVLDSLFISHPKSELRIDALRRYSPIGQKG